jgi:hypothetical protein
MNSPNTELRVELTLYQPQSGGSGIRFTETINVNAQSFAAILKRFHDLFQEIKAQQEKK